MAKGGVGLAFCVYPIHTTPAQTGRTPTTSSAVGIRALHWDALLTHVSLTRARRPPVPPFCATVIISRDVFDVMFL